MGLAVIGGDPEHLAFLPQTASSPTPSDADSNGGAQMVPATAALAMNNLSIAGVLSQVAEHDTQTNIIT